MNKPESLKILGVIPARYASTRFPGKPLVDINGKTMIRRVYEQALQAKSLGKVIVATDDKRIFEEVESFGGNVSYTRPEHNNGTERCAEIAEQYEADVIINIQGDEPYIQPEQIDLLAGCFKDQHVQIATLIKEHPLDDALRSPARVKVAVNKRMQALYFSRSIIPYLRATDSQIPLIYYKHIGIYAFRREVLLELVKLPPSTLELAESLEQLRWLDNGYTIQCAVTEHESLSVDTPEDLEGILNNN